MTKLRINFLLVLLIAGMLLPAAVYAQTSTAPYTSTSPSFAAYDRNASIDVPGPAPLDASWQQLSLADYSAIAAIDSNYKETRRTTARWQYDFQLYRFRITQTISQISSIDTSWYGYGEDKPAYDCYYYIWNFTNNAWELMQNVYAPVPDGVLQGSRDAAEYDLSQYVNSNGYVYTMSKAQHYNYPPNVPSLVSPSNNATIDYNACNPSLDDNRNMTLYWASNGDPDNDPLQYYGEITETQGSWTSASGWTTETYWGYNGGIESNGSILLPDPGNGSLYFFWRARARDGIDTTAFTGYWRFMIRYVPYTWSCPYVFSYDGEKFNFVTETAHGCIDNFKSNPDILYPRYVPLSELKPNKDGQYLVKLRETLSEISYVDELRLVAVEQPNGYQVLSGIAYGMPTGKEFKYYTVKNPKPPVAAKLGDSDVLGLIKSRDNVLIPVDAGGNNSCVLDFGAIERPEFAKLILYGWLVTNPDYTENQLIPYVEVQDEKGGWKKVKDTGLYYGDLTTLVVDLANLVGKNAKIRVSGISPNSPKVFHIDCALIDDSEPVKIETAVMAAETGDFRFRGACNSTTDANLSQPKAVQDTAEAPNPGYQMYGHFTKYGDVKELINAADDKFVIMRCGDELMASFASGKLDMAKNYAFFLKADVLYKTPSLGRTSDPLPSKEMNVYPPDNKNLVNASYREYVTKYNTRFYEEPKETAGLKPFVPVKIKAIEQQKDEPKIPRSLNTNHVQLVINYQGNESPTTPILISPEDDAIGVSTDPDFYWSPSFGTSPITYEIQVVAGAPDFTSANAVIIADITGLTVSNYTTLTGLAANTLFFWRIRASNTFGNSNWSDVWSFDTATAPSVPVMTAPADEKTGVTLSPTLKWEEATGFAPLTYDVQVSPDNLFTELTIDETGVDANEYVLHDLTPNTIYYWHVRAVNSAGTSDWANAADPWFFETGAPCTAPQLSSPILNLTDVSTPTTFIWKAAIGSNPITYSLQISANASFTSTILSLSELQTTSYTTANLLPKTGYYWRVRASNTVGESGWSSEWVFSTAAAQDVTTTTGGTTSSTTSTSATTAAAQDEPIRKCFAGTMAGRGGNLLIAAVLGLLLLGLGTVVSIRK
ncbi:MAG: fibronectin type III domain-containing protein [Planctomycetes bacterium]|nr:fibronectin type III domain-containing protein [Planctomycetota bacterium]